MFLAVPLAGAMPLPAEPGNIEWSCPVHAWELWGALAAAGVGVILTLVIFRRRKFAAAALLCLLLAAGDFALAAWSFRAYTASGVDHEEWSFDPLRSKSTALNVTSGRGGVGLFYADGDGILDHVPQMRAPPVDPVTELYLAHSVRYSVYPGEDIDYSYTHTDRFWDHWPWPELGVHIACDSTPLNAAGEFSIHRAVVLPHWLVVTLLLVTPGAWAVDSLRRAHRRRYRVAHNLCLTCGYDLRGHQAGAAGGKCPECGTAIAGGPLTSHA